MELKLDYSPLTTPITAKQAREILAGSKVRHPTSNIASFIVVAQVSIFVLVLSTGLIAGSIGIINSAGNNVLPFIFLFLGIAVLAFLIFYFFKSSVVKRAKLYWFGLANGFTFQQNGAAPLYEGMIFGIGHSRTTKDRFMRIQGRPIDLANLSYTTGSGKHQQTHSWFYMMVQLDRNLPHIVLDSLKNNFWKLSNLPANFARNQQLSLEGDFDKYFKLYCPNGYERDALYVLNPKLMALLIDFAQTADIEIVDNKLFLYSGKHLDLADPASWKFIEDVINTVGIETVKQTDYYSDERVGNRQMDAVAKEGQRLKGTVLPLYIGAIAAFAAIAYWVITKFG